MAPRERRRGRVLRLHVGLVAALAICVSAFVIEIGRALGGNELSWAYVVEWPVLSGYSVYMWHRLLGDERGALHAVRAEAPRDDEALDAWNRYLAELHAHDAARRLRGGD